MQKKILMKIENSSKDYKMGEVTVNALCDASFEIYEGEFIAILGPSGSGKSTLLNIIGGMDLPTQGKVFLRGDEINKYNDRKLTAYRRDKVGFVFQFYNLMANLTAKENVELATEMCKEALNIDEVMESVELGDRKDHFPSQLSGGEQQRVAIARAVAKNPLMLLCDEPTGALDYKTGLLILSLLHKINRQLKKTVVIITHNMAIGDMADRIIKMRSGRIVEIKENASPIPPERIEW
ncbi:MAG TPA: ABC transporter ATP-binding protein [Bacillota bacterium]|nr:ABC transporter ATP-binding protein [Bacillota bacterium]HNT02482.1 ABC transporter ATP-binding protein [Bacillota bacterium]HPX68421.1 ABC transporter ATP-binding protein [Bacillota bacterium]HQA65569.1 ABC transporter ATP-binding protein [Bacillota bacterium]HQO43374.1 ABC transporter ATP-binding protein [Bacillota bacterium]